ATARGRAATALPVRGTVSESHGRIVRRALPGRTARQGVPHVLRARDRMASRAATARGRAAMVLRRPGMASASLVRRVRISRARETGTDGRRVHPTRAGTMRPAHRAGMVLRVAGREKVVRASLRAGG